MALFYMDASALVKLVREEPESHALRAFLVDAQLVSCELVLTEIPRAIRRAAAQDPRLALDVLMARAGEMRTRIPGPRRWLLASRTTSGPAKRSPRCSISPVCSGA